MIGAAIGSSVTPAILGQAPSWWPTLLAMLPFVIAVQLANFALLRRLGGYDRPTAYFASSPGGLVDAVLLGEPVIGAAIGSSVTPAILGQAPSWWPTLLAMLPFV
ncbi:hypothetical protein CNY89_26460, partial [Amaricoccus sp. HAR-UPW-R2A-40]